MLKVDTTTLSTLIGRCFDNSMDGRFSQAQRNIWLADGKRLRGLLMNLLSAQFDDGNQSVIDANALLSKVNLQLSDSISTLNHAASVLDDVSNLVGGLDKLLNLATHFV